MTSLDEPVQYGQGQSKIQPDVDTNHTTLITNKHLIYLVVVVFSVVGALCLILPSPYNIVPFGIVVGIAFLTLTIKYPLIGTYLYLVIFFFEPNNLWPTSVQYERIVAITVLVSIVLHQALKDKRFQIYPMDKAFAAFLLVCFVSIVFSPGDLFKAWNVFFHMFRLFIVYVLISRVTYSLPRLKVVIWLYMLSVAFFAVYATYNYYTGNYTVAMGIDRATSFGSLGDPNSLANSLIIGMPFLFFMMRHHRSLLVRWFLGIAILTSVWTIVITGSRGGMIGLLVCALVLTAFSQRKLMIMSIIVVVLAASFVLMPGQYHDRMATITDLSGESGAAESARGRIDGLVAGLKFMIQRPLTGVGIGNFSWANLRFGNGVWLDAHNLLGKLAGELAIPGLLTFGYFIYVFFKSIRRIRKKYAENGWVADFMYHVNDALMVSLIMLFWQGITGHNLYRFNWYFFAALTLVLTNNLAKRSRCEQQTEAISISAN